MMMFIGLILLVAYAIATVKGGFFVETLKEGQNVDKYVESEEFKNKSGEEQEKYALTMLLKSIGALVSSVFLLFLFICFLIGALSIDVILVPTIVLLALLVIKTVLVCSSKNYRERVKTRKIGMFRRRLTNLVYFLYVLYILILIIL